MLSNALGETLLAVTRPRIPGSPHSPLPPFPPLWRGVGVPGPVLDLLHKPPPQYVGSRDKAPAKGDPNTLETGWFASCPSKDRSSAREQQARQRPGAGGECCPKHTARKSEKPRGAKGARVGKGWGQREHSTQHKGWHQGPC